LGTSLIRAALLLATVCGSSAVAGTIVQPSALDVANAYDVSFQDGRTSSLIGHGVPGYRGVVETGDPDDPGPVSYCYSADHPPSPQIMAALEAAMQQYTGRYQLQGSSWGTANVPITLTWSLVPDGTLWGDPSQPGGQAASNLFSRMDSLFGASNRAVWVQQIQSCLDRWAALSGVSYTRVRDTAGDDWDDGAAWGNGSGANRGQIRIGMHNIDGVNGILAYCYFPTNGDMVIDSSENWNTGGNYLYLRNVVTHEHGHGLGLAHVCPSNQTKLMEPFVSTAYDGPQQDDIRGVSALYGDSYEPNNSPTAPFDLGTLAPGSTTTIGNVPNPVVSNAATACISTATDLDYFKFTLATPRLVDFTLTPIGSNYADYPQDANCNTTTVNDNSLAAANLAVTAYLSNGTTSARVQDANPAGSGETISGLMLSTGVSYAKVSATGWTGAQLYKLTVAVRSTILTPSVSYGTYTDRVHISWTAVPDATSYKVYRNLNDAIFGGVTAATLAPTATSFDDTVAAQGQVYYYFVEVQQPGDTNYRFMNTSGVQGYRDSPPVADAGPDQNVVDTDNNGSQAVTLDGSASTHDGEGSILLYTWTEGPATLAQSSDPTSTVTFSVGVHTVMLTVTDSSGFTGSDTVMITVSPPGNHCGSADFNCDGAFGTDADIDAFFACLAGSCPPPPCTSNADFNGDGASATDADIESFFRVLSGGPC
jgi:hypothetical protein